mgnify:CR=1 FL=1
MGFDDVSAISIEPVSLLTPTNTITSGGIWGLLFILAIPAALLIYGFVRWDAPPETVRRSTQA